MMEALQSARTIDEYIDENGEDLQKINKFHSISMSDFGHAIVKLDRTSASVSEDLVERRQSVVHAKTPVAPQEDYFDSPRQSFVGTVISVNNDSREFDARIVDRTDVNRSDEIATFSFESIPEPDISLIKSGAEFFWYIGYKQGVRTPRENFSKIRFRRLAKWTAKDINRINKKASDTWAKLFA